jgi:hypothetical protein
MEMYVLILKQALVSTLIITPRRNEKDRRHSNASPMDYSSDAYVHGRDDTDPSYSHTLENGDRC